MDGIFLVNKPKNLTSRDVCNKLIKKFHFKKIGHVGTLDPFATGLLVVVAGKATKTATFLEQTNKHYIASLKLGEKTDTLDLTGKVLEKKPVPELSKEQIKKVLHSFVGSLNQVPPMYSAIKCQGVPLYKLARSNVEISRKMRTIFIYNVRFIKYENNIIRFSLECSKGTYVRTFGEQLAEKLNTVGHLIELKRTKVGPLNLKDAKSLRTIMPTDMRSIYDSLKYMDTIEVDDNVAQDIKNGKPITLTGHDKQVFLVDLTHSPLAIYAQTEGDTYRCVRGLF